MLRRLFAGLSLLLGAMLLISALGLAYARRNVDTLEYVLVGSNAGHGGFFVGNGRFQRRLSGYEANYGPEEGIMRVSHDKRWFLFTGYLDSGSDRGIYRISPTETEAIFLNEETARSYLYEVTSDGWVIFGLYSAGNNSSSQSLLGNLYRVHMDGQDLMNLTNRSSTTQSIEQVIALNETSQVIIFYGNSLLYGPQTLFRVGVDGEDLQRLTNFSGSFYSYTLTPDGQAIIFMGRVNEQHDIYRLEIDSGELLNLTNHPDSNTFKGISPDGRWVIFTRTTEERETYLYRVGLDGEGLLQLAEMPIDYVMLIPNTQHLIYSYREEDQHYTYLARIDGEGARLISQLDSLYQTIAFTPDGQGMIFESRRGGSKLIYYLNLNLESDELLPLINDNNYTYAGLSTDGQWVYLSYYQGTPKNPKNGLYRIGLDGQNLQHLSEQGGYHLATLEHPMSPFRPALIGGGGLALLILGWGLRRKVA